LYASTKTACGLNTSSAASADGLATDAAGLSAGAGDGGPASDGAGAAPVPPLGWAAVLAGLVPPVWLRAYNETPTATTARRSATADSATGISPPDRFAGAAAAAAGGGGAGEPGGFAIGTVGGPAGSRFEGANLAIGIVALVATIVGSVAAVVALAGHDSEAEVSYDSRGRYRSFSATLEAYRKPADGVRMQLFVFLDPVTRDYGIDEQKSAGATQLSAGESKPFSVEVKDAYYVRLRLVCEKPGGMMILRQGKLAR
jgi:hypothetical protein